MERRKRMIVRLSNCSNRLTILPERRKCGKERAIRCSRAVAPRADRERWKRKELSQVLSYAMGCSRMKGVAVLRKIEPRMMQMAK